ncbi:spermidine synthase [Nocardioides panzhihuensis]|uniref:Spermidine synthase n=1 Tax=Nocardioides panzhihuensis TaxID=860243 RepID=A0A7Z0DML9_9ACTN|nr:fused MFS/spermidine synthase [Nocardioides panzhihuensis]NYI78180.1 spermidine synthase [Nocardioides panzhihuensis]
MPSDVYVLELDDMQQSAVDLGDPTRLVFDYMRRVGDVIDRLPPGPVRVLHVGGAAMTLPRYVHATRPRSSQIVLEPSVEIIERVRREAPLPPRSGIKVRPVDGKSGIGGVRDGFADMVVLDAFDGGHTPAELTSAAFVEDVRRVLAPSGVFVANLVDRAPFARVRDFVAAARDLGDMVIGVEPATMKGRRSGNLIIACGAVPSSPFGSPSPMEYRIFADRAVTDSFGGGTRH